MRTFSALALRTGGALVISAASLSMATAANSDDLYNRYFANVLDGAPCFARTYDDAFLTDHPAHQVRRIEIDLAKHNADGSPNSADRFQIGFALMVRSAPAWYGEAASCKANETDFECFLQGDGVTFHLLPQSGGGLRLETGEDGIAIEGGAGDVAFAGKGNGNHSFDLVQSKEECQSAAAFFEGSNEQ